MIKLNRGRSKIYDRMRRFIRPALAICLLAVVINMLAVPLRTVDWRDVWRAIDELPKIHIVLATGMTFAAYIAYAGKDLLGKRYVNHDMPDGRVWGFALISHALSINLGTIIGGFGARLRFYLRMGYSKSVPTRMAVFSVFSNWLGFGWLAGIIFLCGGVPLPDGMPWGGSELRLAGGALLALSTAYVWACWRYAGRSWTVKKYRVELPSAKIAVLQCLISSVSWGLMSLVFHITLRGDIPYIAVLGVLLFCSVVALIMRIPGGLGTTEVIASATLSQFMAASEIIAAVLVYRVIYFFLPLAIALLAYGVLEIKWRMQKSASHRRLRGTSSASPRQVDIRLIETGSKG